MWEHFCKNEKTTLFVGNGETCNWCGLQEANKKANDQRGFLQEINQLQPESAAPVFIDEVVDPYLQTR